MSKTLKEKIEVMQAALDGKEIEYKNCASNKWNKCSEPEMNFEYWGCGDYRIKPEPMEFWVNVYNCDDIEIFTHKESAEIAGRCTSNFIKTIKVREVLE